MFATVGLMAQGNILFQNKVSNPLVDAKVTDSATMAAVAANTFTAALWAGLTADSLAPAIDATTGAAIATTITGATGYFAGGSHSVQGIAAGVDAFFQVRVYDKASSSWATSLINGKSDTITLKLTAPPATPQALVGLKTFSVAPVPEPSVIALGVLGVGAFFMLRRRS